MEKKTYYVSLEEIKRYFLLPPEEIIIEVKHDHEMERVEVITQSK